jgi:hypothetical protein
MWSEDLHCHLSAEQSRLVFELLAQSAVSLAYDDLRHVIQMWNSVWQRSVVRGEEDDPDAVSEVDQINFEEEDEEEEEEEEEDGDEEDGDEDEDEDEDEEDEDEEHEEHDDDDNEDEAARG